MATTPSSDISLDELQLAARNHALPLEALRYDITPVGLHYLLTHFDIPYVDGLAWRLQVGGRVSRPLTLTLAFFGVGIAAFIVAAGMHWVIGWSWIGAALFGVLIAATDPVSVIVAFAPPAVVARRARLTALQRRVLGEDVMTTYALGAP